MITSLSLKQERRRKKGFETHQQYLRSFLSSSQDFLTQLVCNLLDEGNAFYRDGDWEQAGREFSEGLNVSHYAAAEDIQIPGALLESLYVNRAAAYQSMVRYVCCCVFLRRCAIQQI